MNNLLFTALLIALLYYFCYYLPSQKKLNPDPTKLTHSIFTQTEPIPNTTENEIDNLKEQLKAKDQKIKELSKVENQVDQLIKNVQALNNEL